MILQHIWAYFRTTTILPDRKIEISRPGSGQICLKFRLLYLYVDVVVDTAFMRHLFQRLESIHFPVSFNTLSPSATLLSNASQQTNKTHIYQIFNSRCHHHNFSPIPLNSHHGRDLLQPLLFGTRLSQMWPMQERQLLQPGLSKDPLGRPQRGL